MQLPLGYGDVGNLTLNTPITGMQQNYTNIFLRKTFTIAPGQIPSQLSIRSTSDDGFVMWINGVEVELASIQLYYDISICSVTERHAAVDENNLKVKKTDFERKV